MIETWDSFLPLVHHLRSTNLLVAEESLDDDVSFSYLLIYNNENRLAAICYFQKIHFQQKHYLSPFEKFPLLKPLERFVTRNGFHLLVCGNLLRIDSCGLFYNPDLANASQIFSLLENFYQSNKPQADAILIKDWNEETDIEWVNENKYSSWEGDLTMKFNVNALWNNFDDYTKSLRHRYAQRVRKSRKLLYPLVRRELTAAEIESFTNELETLYKNVVLKQSIRLVIVKRNYFMEMKSRLGPKFRIHGYFKNEKLVGFTSQILNDELLELHFIGLDYEMNQKHWLYFNMLYDAIDDAITLKKSQIELGRTARQAKSNIGAYAVYFKNYFRIRGFITSTLVNLLRKSFNENNESNYGHKKPMRTP